MHRAIVDVLQPNERYLDTAGLEMELRMPLPPCYFDLIHATFAYGRESVYVTDELVYADHTDLRCINTVWQRKRRVSRVRLPGCIIPFHMCVSVESPAQKTSLHVDWKDTTRERWCYDAGRWQIDWTKSSRACNVEIEYVGHPRELLAAMRDGDNGLSLLVADIARYCMITAYGKVRTDDVTVSPIVPFSAFSGRDQPIDQDARRMYRKLAQQNQPTSLFDDMSPAIDPMVSLKYDGQRMVVCVQQYNADTWVVWGLGRLRFTYSIPCASATSEMVLDCEFMAEDRRFIVFDMYEFEGRALKCMPYTARINMLNQVALPELIAGYTMERKVFFPPDVVTQAWYDEQDVGKCDGLIIHDKSGILGEPVSMYKWKPHHTVDLMVHKHGYMCDTATQTRFLGIEPGHGFVINHLEVWECEFTADMKNAKLIRRRFDKTRSNPLHVLRDIRCAHTAQMSLETVGTLLKKLAV